MKTIKKTELPDAYLNDPDKLRNYNGILLSDMIEKYVEQSVLISPRHFLDDTIKDPFDKKKVEAASYDLRLGRRCFIAGKGYQDLSERDLLTIPPHGMAVVSTYECLVMPRYMIGRWNLRIGLVYKGLLWSGGPQVDPGFVGPLHCTLFNMSNRDVILEFKEHIVTIDFVKTSPLNAVGDSKWFYHDKVKNEEIEIKEISDYIKDTNIESAVEGIGKTAEEARARVSEMSLYIISAFSIIMAVLALVVTLPTYSSIIAEALPPSPTLYSLLAFSFSCLALIFSVSALLLKKAERRLSIFALLRKRVLLWLRNKD